MDFLTPYIPDRNDGFLPFWLLIVAVAALGNTAANYVSPAAAARVYAGPTSDTVKNKPQPQLMVKPSPSSAPIPVDLGLEGLYAHSPVTPLSARCFATWNFLSAVVRIYAAYNIHEKVAYDLGAWTFVIAAVHFVSEWQVYGTARWQKGFATPMFVASSSLAWMLTTRGGYLNL